jgi:hypothetical protein
MTTKEYLIKAQWKNLANRAMARKLSSGEAVDVSAHRTQVGTYELPADLAFEDLDLCDAKRELWIWSVGRERTTARRTFAATDGRFYQNADYDCLWLR